MALCGKRTGQTRCVMGRTHQSIGRQVLVGVVAFPKQARRIEMLTHIFTGFLSMKQLVLIEKVRNDELARTMEQALTPPWTRQTRFALRIPPVRYHYRSCGERTGGRQSG